MKKFEKVTEPVELDFFTICEDNGVKYIHIFGYSYKSDSREYVSENNPNGIYWANMECCWFIEPLTDFVAHIKENKDYVNDTYCELNQYQGDFTGDEMVDIINQYFDGNPADYYLSFENVTEETPCGNYVC